MIYVFFRNIIVLLEKGRAVGATPCAEKPYLCSVKTLSRQSMNIRLVRRLRARHALLAILLVAVTAFQAVPALSGVYTHHVYPVVAHVLAPLSSLVPFAVGDVFIALSIAWVAVYPPAAILIGKRKVKPVLLRTGEYLLWVYVWFYAAWGLNYAQPNIFHRLRMAPAEADTTVLRAFAERYADSLNACWTPAADAAIRRVTPQATYEGYLRLRHMGINRPVGPQVRAKTMVFSRLSSMAGITGSMGPFFCEMTLNGDVRPHAYPSTYAHEYAHLLGIANEGEANFYSYIVCTHAADRAVRFSGYYMILFHVLHNVRALLGEDAYRACLARIRPEVIALARADRRYWLERRSPLIDNVQTFLFDLYLRGNRVDGGTRSYSGVVAIIMAWERSSKPTYASHPSPRAKTGR